jgi:general secretion pathway protein L
VARFVGIDVGEKVVRVALLRTAYRRVAVEALVHAPIEAEGGEEKAIATALAGMKPDAIALALAGDRCFYRRIELPLTAQREIQSVLGFELESTVPFEMDACVFDHRVLKRTGTQPLIVFSALAKTEDVKERIDLVKRAVGREPDVVGTGAVPLANLVNIVPELDVSREAPAPARPARPLALEGQGLPDDERPTPLPVSPTAPIALLDLGESRSEILLLVGGEPAFARTLSRGTAGVTDKEVAQALVADLSRTFGAWRSQGGEPVRKLYLVGLGASMQGAEAYLSATLGLPVARLRIPVLEGVLPDQAHQLPLYAKAIALALSLEGRSRSLDLRSGPLAAARSYAFLREKIPLLSGLAAVIVVSFAFSIVSQLRALGGERAILDAELRATTKDVFGEETADMARAHDLLDKGPGAGDEDPAPGADAFDVMVLFSKSVPKQVGGIPLVHDVLELDLNRGHVSITSVIPKEVDAAATTDKVVQGMQANACFKDVKIDKVTQYGNDKQKYVLEFDVRCEDKKPAVKKKPEGDTSPSDPKATP